MASPNNVKELRLLYPTTFNETFTAADNAAWAAGTAIKPKTISIDASGLIYNSQEDETIENLLHTRRANIPTTRGGSIKFGVYGEGGNTDTSDPVLATLLSKIMGGLQGVTTSRTDSIEASSSTVSLNLTSHELLSGMGCLVGTPGDGGGDGAFRVVTYNDANSVNLDVAVAADPSSTTAVLATTVFHDPTATQSYIDTLLIGHDATDQLQTIGGQATFEIEGQPNEVPRFNFEVTVADWQEVASGDRDQLEPTTPATANPPPVDRYASVILQNDGTTTLQAFKAANIKINPGIVWELEEAAGGVNGICDHVRMTSVPTIEMDIILDGSADPLPGFYDDFVNSTAKQLIIQYGKTAGKCMAIDMPRCFFTGAPVRSEVGRLSAVKVMLHGGNNDSNGNTSAFWLRYSPIRFHFA